MPNDFPEVPGYHLTKRIGEGALAVVYRATPAQGGVPVAVKVLSDSAADGAALRKRFEREARILAAIDHPGIVRITDYGVTKQGQAFLVMDLAPGRTVEERLEEGTIEPTQALAWVIGILEGLDYAHGLGVVHRDLKPANIIVTDDGETRLLDFGLAKFVGEPVAGEQVTAHGRIVGTPAYMAPEQITGRAVDNRTDLYAVGLLLFEMLADRRPFDEADRAKILRAHLFSPVPPLDEVRPGLEVQPSLEALIYRCLSKDPANRPSSAQEVLAELRKLGPSAVVSAPVTPRSKRRRQPTDSDLVVLTSDSEFELPSLRSGDSPFRATPSPIASSDVLAWAAGLFALVVFYGLGAWAALGL